METRKDRFSVPVKKLHDTQSLSYLLCMVICTHIVMVCIDGLQMSIVSILLPEGKYMIKKQLYSGTFTLNAAASFIFRLMKRTRCSASLPVFCT